MYSGSLWQKNCGLDTGRRDRRKPLFYAVFIFYNNNLPMHLLYNQKKGGGRRKRNEGKCISMQKLAGG